MTQHIRSTPLRDGRLAWVVALLLVLLALFKQGQDANWDLRNYHLYTPSALLDGRFGDDIAAAQLQTWHNPALDIPFAWMVKAGLPGWLVSMWLALPSFIAILFALRLLDLAWPLGRSATRTVMAGLAAVTGAAVMPSIGTTFNDAVVAAGVMAALWWIADSQGRRHAWATWLPAGLMAGACAGLKLTGALYCIGFIAAALACGPMRGLPLRILALAIGGLAGSALTAGPWALHLWQAHGNPLFPYFNDWFGSVDALPQAYKDGRFIPHGIDALLVPFHLLTDSSRFSEGEACRPPRTARLRLAWRVVDIGVAGTAAGRRRDADRPCPSRVRAGQLCRVGNALWHLPLPVRAGVALLHRPLRRRIDAAASPLCTTCHGGARRSAGRSHQPTELGSLALRHPHGVGTDAGAARRQSRGAGGR